MGIACVVGGCVLFSVSKSVDPLNRAALATIVMLIVGTGWIGQALRGSREATGVRELAPLEGPPVSPDKMLLGLAAAWFVPGGGHWLLGQRSKAILYFVTITFTFVVGIALAQGRNFNYERDAVYYLAYAFNGFESLLAWLTLGTLELSRPVRYLQLGFLYSAVACLLNVVAMMDYIATVGRIGHPSGVASEAGSTSPGSAGEERA
jgi:hypothetical protein